MASCERSMLAAHAKQEVRIMKVSFRIVAVALALAPVAALAQSQTSGQPSTHAQLIDQLTQLRQDGYVPSKIHYPADIQAAQARMDMRAGTSAASNSGVGGAMAGATQSGARATFNPGARPMYGHH
jgi:hypothetical protein